MALQSQKPRPIPFEMSAAIKIQCVVVEAARNNNGAAPSSPATCVRMRPRRMGRAKRNVVRPIRRPRRPAPCPRRRRSGAGPWRANGCRRGETGDQRQCGRQVAGLTHAHQRAPPALRGNFARDRWRRSLHSRSAASPESRGGVRNGRQGIRPAG